MASAQLTLIDGAAAGGGAEKPRDLSCELQQMTARQIWFLLPRHMKLVASITLAGVLVVMIVKLQLPNRYEETANLQAEHKQSTGHTTATKRDQVVTRKYASIRQKNT